MQTILLIKQVRTQQSDGFFQILEKQLKMSLPCTPTKICLCKYSLNYARATMKQQG